MKTSSSMQSVVYLVHFGEPELINEKDILFQYQKILKKNKIRKNI